MPLCALYGVALLLCADMARRMFPTGRTITAVTITLALALASPLLMLTPFIDPRAPWWPARLFCMYGPRRC